MDEAAVRPLLLLVAAALTQFNDSSPQLAPLLPVALRPSARIVAADSSSVAAAASEAPNPSRDPGKLPALRCSEPHPGALRPNAGIGGTAGISSTLASEV